MDPLKLYANIIKQCKYEDESMKNFIRNMIVETLWADIGRDNENIWQPSNYSQTLRDWTPLTKQQILNLQLKTELLHR